MTKKNVLNNVKLLASFGFANLMKDFANQVKDVDFKNPQNIGESIWNL